MIKLREKVSKYPSRTVLEDIITRMGPPTKDSFTPFNGCADIVRSQFCGERQENKYNELDFIKYYIPYDFTPTKRNVAVQEGLLVDAKKKSSPFSTLEDVVSMNAEEEVRAWVKDCCIGYKKNSNSSYAAFRNYTMTFQDEDGKGTDEQELLIKYSDSKVKQREKEVYLQKLPYYVRLIWNYSIMYKANLFGFIYAWMDITINQRKANPIIRDFNGNYIYERLKSNGTHHRNFEYSEDVRDTTFRNAIEIFLAPGRHQAEFTAIKEFAKIIKALDIDFANENCMDITKEVVDNLRCTYLPSFKEYSVQFADLDIEINYAIRSANIFNTKKIDIYKSTNLSVTENNKNMFIKTASDRIKLLYQAAKNLVNCGKQRDTVVQLFNHSREDVVKLVNTYVYKVTGRNVDMSPLLDFDKDIFLHMNGEVFYQKGSPFGLYSSTSDYNVYITIYGFIVVDTGDAAELVVLPYNECMKKLGEDYVTNEGTKWFIF